MAKRDQITLYLFIDALGWEILRRHPHFLDGLAQERRPLETVFGYSSACDPSIITGKLPNQHGYWSAFYYSPQTCPYRWIKQLSWLPSLITDYHKVRHRLSRWIAQSYGFTGYFQLYNMPFARLPYFDYAEKYRIWQPNGMPGSRNLFDVWEQCAYRYFVDDRPIPDADKLADAERRIRECNTDAIYLLLGQLDGLMHAEGPESGKVSRLLDWYDGKIRRLVEAAHEHAHDVRWLLFSDHGMHAVSGGYDLQRDIEALGLRFGTDYAAVYDSTMARFYFLNDKARNSIGAALDGHPQGRWLSNDELRSWGTYFEDHKYGERIFLMNSGTMIAPSDMGRKAIKGMHGFHPDDPDSKAAVLSPVPLDPDLQRIEQLFHTLSQPAPQAALQT